MLIGIPDIIGSDLLKALADTGHGDLIVIADHFYPPYSKSPHAVSIQAKGTGSAEMLDAVLQLVPLDTEYEKSPSGTSFRIRNPAWSWKAIRYGMM